MPDRSRRAAVAITITAAAFASLMSSCASSPERSPESYDHAAVLDCMRRSGGEVTDGPSKVGVDLNGPSQGAFAVEWYPDYRSANVAFTSDGAELDRMVAQARHAGDTDEYLVIKKNVIATVTPPGPQSPSRAALQVCLP